MAEKRKKNKPEPSVDIQIEAAAVEASAINRMPVKWQFLIIALLLIFITAIVYSGVLRAEFINYDDTAYITTNVHVTQGLSWENIKWALTSTHASNWHPLTWLSHMLDVQFFGLYPAGHHFSNMFFHIIATLLLFGFLRYTTGKMWTSALVSALFALHPTHVESVAWVAERKDVLSAMFWFATIGAYVFYSRRPDDKRYLLVVVLFLLGIMAKPMLVTLPLILLLLDYWPLERLTLNWIDTRRLIIEKLPLIFLAVFSSIMTIIAQQRAIGGLNRIHIATRLSNAVISYCVYLWQTIWPAKLSLFYPYVQHTNPIKIIVCALLLIAITAIILLNGREKKYLITGWFWFIVTLIPVIGILQVGDQAHADRYTYISTIGIFIIFAWGLSEISKKLDKSKSVIVNTAVLVILLVMSLITRKQVGYWENSFTLFNHAIEAIKDNENGHYNLGNLLWQTGRRHEAITQYRIALKIKPDKSNALNNLAGVYFETGQFSKAVPLMERALTLAKAAGDEALVKDITDNIDLLNEKIDSLKEMKNNKNAEP